MSESNISYEKTDIVVEGFSNAPLNIVTMVLLRRLVAALAVVMALVLWITPIGYAEETNPTDSTTGLLNGSITDTENLLGANVNRVTDAIDHLHETTGVSVRLLYLTSFNAGEGDVDQWANDVLESTDPEPNTVMLAVASHDGSLVVAVSSNSDEWLLRQDTVDELSQAALTPLVDGDDPQWADSAIAMIEKIEDVKQHTSSPTVTVIGLAVFGGVIAVIAVIAVVVIVKRRHKAGRHRAGDKSTVESEESSENIEV